LDRIIYNRQKRKIYIYRFKFSINNNSTTEMLATLSPGFWSKLSIFFALQVILIAQATEYEQPSLEKRGFAFGPAAAAGAGSSSDKPHGPPKDPSETLPERCKLKPLTPQTWATLQLDNYLQKYPGGANMTLSVGLLHSYIGGVSTARIQVYRLFFDFLFF
jgi:hypothetical protein